MLTSSSNFPWHFASIASLASILSDSLSIKLGIMQVGRPSWPACSSVRRTRSTSCTASCSAVLLPLASANRKRFMGFFRISGLEGDPVLILEPVLPRLGLVSRKVVCSTIFAVELVALVTAD